MSVPRVIATVLRVREESKMSSPLDKYIESLEKAVRVRSSQAKKVGRSICIAKNVRFSWKPHRLTLDRPDRPAIYHWLWFNFRI